MDGRNPFRTRLKPWLKLVAGVFTGEIVFLGSEDSVHPQYESTNPLIRRGLLFPG